MAAFTVTTTADAGEGSLRAALASAADRPGRDSVVFDKALSDRTITLSSRLVITDADGVTVHGDIDGDGAIDITVSGDTDRSGRFNPGLAGGSDDPHLIDAGDSAFLLVRSGAKAVIEDMRFDGGFYAGAPGGGGGAGGVIVNSGDLTIRDSEIIGARVAGAVAPAGGTGQDLAVVANRAGGRMTLLDDVFDQAYVFGASAPRIAGGRGGSASLIHNAGTLTADRLTTGGDFVGGAGVVDSEDNSPPLTDGGDAHFGILNEGVVTGDEVLIQRIGLTNVTGGWRGRILRDGAADSYGAYGLQSAADAAMVVNRDGGSFAGFSAFGPIIADPASTSRDFSGAGERIGFLGIGGNDGVVGSRFDDRLHMGDGRDAARGGDGADVIGGGQGGDSLFGDAGDDEIRGGAGDDHLEGGAGDDLLFGEAGDDAAFGGAGVDRAWGAEGADRLLGGGARDFLFGGAEGDALFGGGGRDVIRGGAGGDEIRGGGGKDNLRGDAGGDDLFGGGGSDRIKGGGGRDRVEGGGGKDKLLGNGGADRLDGGGGKDKVSGGGGRDEVEGGGGRDKVLGGGGGDKAYGGGGADKVLGGGGRDKLFGGGGEDKLFGGGGKDRLVGGPGDDLMIGGGGADRFVLGDGDGFDVIRGFRPGSDVIEAKPSSGFGDLDLRAHADGTLLVLDDGRVLIEGVDPDDLDPGDFIF